MIPSEPEYIDPSQVRQGPIRHESLPPELLKQVGTVYTLIGPYLGTTLEQFEVGFMRDAHPEHEVAIWVCIAAAWLAYHKKFLGDQLQADEDEAKLVGALVAISTGVDDLQRLRVPPEVGRRLIACYDGLGNE